MVIIYRARGEDIYDEALYQDQIRERWRKRNQTWVQEEIKWVMCFL